MSPGKGCTSAVFIFLFPFPCRFEIFQIKNREEHKTVKHSLAWKATGELPGSVSTAGAAELELELSAWGPWAGSALWDPPGAPCPARGSLQAQLPPPKGPGCHQELGPGKATAMSDARQTHAYLPVSHTQIQKKGVVVFKGWQTTKHRRKKLKFVSHSNWPIIKLPSQVCAGGRHRGGGMKAVNSSWRLQGPWRE